MADETDESAIYTPVWILSGLTGRTSAGLEFADGRVILSTGDVDVFNVALNDVRDVKFPWYYFGGGVKFRVGAQEYRISFTEPGEHGSTAGARAAGKLWRAVLNK
jgi:hypothetical protein